MPGPRSHPGASQPGLGLLGNVKQLENSRWRKGRGRGQPGHSWGVGQCGPRASLGAPLVILQH